MKRSYRRIALTAALALISSLAFAGMAAAHHGSQDPATACDQVVTADLTLTHDVGPCPSNGLRLGASGTSTNKITVNLAGYKVFGPTQSTDGAGKCALNPQPYSASLGAGVLIEDQNWVEVKGPGTVKCFSGGVEIRASAGTGTADDNTVTGLTVIDNVGNVASDWGEGIGLWDAKRSVITNNVVDRNGPFAGIGLYGATDSTIDGNIVRDNNFPVQGGTTNQDDGIRVEIDAADNTVTGNTVTGSGLDGIALFSGATDNIVNSNVVQGNGNHTATHRKGDGIRLFGSSATYSSTSLLGANRNTLKGNTIERNAAHGIYVEGDDNIVGGSAIGGPNTVKANVLDGIRLHATATVRAQNNTVNGNTATGNNTSGGSSNTDLHDARLDNECGNIEGLPNLWGNLAANTFGTRNRNSTVYNYCID